MKNKQQQYGQFFTPDNLSKYVLDLVNKYKKIEGDILEPSYGEGSFLNQLLKYNDVNIDAFEVDKNVFKSITGVNTKLFDFIMNDIEKKYDFIIGNPPYIELIYSFYSDEERKIILEKYKQICSGRMNLCHIFLYKSFKQLKKNGIIAYLLPSVILTSPVYTKIRMIMYEYFEIKHIEKDVKFNGVAIKVSLLILQKKKSIEKPFFLNYNNNYYICENYQEYPKNINDTFSTLGYKANIGEVVWNQEKELLSTDSNEKVLVYSTNIEKDNLTIKEKISSDKDKKQYIKNYEVKYKNCIIMPRTISKKIKYHLILNNDKYVFENHVIVITHEKKEKLIELYEKIKENKLDKFFNLFFNSSNLSIDELSNLPINE